MLILSELLGSSSMNPVFNTMNSSDGVSILHLEASFDSGAGGGGAGGYKRLCQNFWLVKNPGKISENAEENTAIFGHRCFDTFILIV